jgi:hypothetical protein
MRTHLLLVALLLAGCPEQSGQECPPNTTSIGQYTLTRSATHDAGECVALNANDASVPIGLDDAGLIGATFCSVAASDGGIQLQLLVTGKGGVRTSDLLADGGFHFVSDPVLAQNTACICDVSLVESFDGYLLTAGAFALQPDGGLPPVNAIAGTVTDQVTPAGTGCRCNAPCPIVYAVSGTRY